MEFKMESNKILKSADNQIQIQIQIQKPESYLGRVFLWLGNEGGSQIYHWIEYC